VATAGGTGAAGARGAPETAGAVLPQVAGLYQDPPRCILLSDKNISISRF